MEIREREGKQGTVVGRDEEIKMEYTENTENREPVRLRVAWKEVVDL
jgi:hypothetical protein